MEILKLALTTAVLTTPFAAGVVFQIYSTFRNWKIALTCAVGCILLDLICVAVILFSNISEFNWMVYVFVLSNIIVCFSIASFYSKDLILSTNGIVTALYCLVFWIIVLEEILAGGSNFLLTITVLLPTLVITLGSLYLAINKDFVGRNTLEILTYVWMSLFLVRHALGILYFDLYKNLGQTTTPEMVGRDWLLLFFSGSILFYAFTTAMTALMNFPIFKTRTMPVEVENERVKILREEVNRKFQNTVFTKVTLIIFAITLATLAILKWKFLISDTTLIFLAISASNIFLTKEKA